MPSSLRLSPVVLCILIAACAGPPLRESTPADDFQAWSDYLGDGTRSHYSALDDIDTGNVQRLEKAWTYRSGGASPEGRSQIQFSPLMIDGLLIGASPELNLFALDAATGDEVWRFDPGDEDAATSGISRGVAYWEDGADRRIFFSAGHDLFAIDASTGTPIRSFGENGSIDLRKGLGRDFESLPVFGKTPGSIYRDLLIMGTSLTESPGAAPGDIRAYDVRTGEIVWTFHTIPHPGEFGYDTWPEDAWTYAGGANNWTGTSIDRERGIVYVPTGSAAYDFYGGNRKGKNLFANSLIALDAATGERIWHFQFVHHDLWDRDLPAPPNLVTVRRDGREIPAVAQVTKSGHVFVFDRVTGEPLFPIEEVPVPASDVPGEEAWPTQPLPTKPEPFSRQEFTSDMVNDLFEDSRARLNDMVGRVDSVRQETIGEVLASLRQGTYEPPSLQGNLMYPGFDGGAEWGGAGYDPTTGVLYVNANEMPWIYRLREVEEETGETLYAAQCARCHGGDRGGVEGMAPGLTDLEEVYTRDSVVAVIREGRGAMPAFGHLPENEIEALAAFVYEGEIRRAESGVPEGADVPYVLETFGRFLDERGYPAVEPPWGTLNAIDLDTGELVWKVPLGEFDDLTERGIPRTGTENYGGPVVTAGGLVFIAATKDERIHAFDKATGDLLWEAPLPAGGYATPITYQVRGRQYVVIACGGGKMGTNSGDAYVAFALPE